MSHIGGNRIDVITDSACNLEAEDILVQPKLNLIRHTSPFFAEPALLSFNQFKSGENGMDDGDHYFYSYGNPGHQVENIEERNLQLPRLSPSGGFRSSLSIVSRPQDKLNVTFAI